MSLAQLSPYNYERIEIVLKIIQAADANVASFSISQVKNKNKSVYRHICCLQKVILQTCHHCLFHAQAMGLLQHLKSYKRISPPSDLENTYLLENNLLPNLSDVRLPFHLLLQTKHFWKIICELKTFACLISLAGKIK